MAFASLSSPAPYRLLVVDSERTILDLLGEVLTDDGAHPTLADDLPSALAALDREHFDVILADTLDRGTADAAFDLWASLEALKARAHSTPVVVFSAYPASAFAEVRARGFAGFIAKPFDLDVLAQRVRVYAAAATAQREGRTSEAARASI